MYIDVNNGNKSMLPEDVKTYIKSPESMVEATLEYRAVLRILGALGTNPNLKRNLIFTPIS